MFGNGVSVHNTDLHSGSAEKGVAGGLAALNSAGGVDGDYMTQEFLSIAMAVS